MKMTATYAMVLSSLIAFSGCGSSDDSSNETASGPFGYYLDSAVEGANYICGDLNGTTDKDGKFNFQTGKDCTFSIGKVLLRTVKAEQLKNAVKVVEDNVSVAAFLQTLDADGNASNGITILPKTAKVFKDNGFTTLPQDDANLSHIMNTVAGNISGYHGNLVSKTDASQHIKTTEQNVTKNLLANKKFYVVFDDATGIFITQINKDVTNINIQSETGSFNMDNAVKLDGNVIVWLSTGKRSDVIEYTDHILVVNHKTDGTSSCSYLFETKEAANNFANNLASQVKAPAGLQLVAPADPSSLDLASYNVLIFYKNTSFNKYNYFANDKNKYAALLNKSVSCIDYGFDSTQEVQKDTQAGILTTTYFDQAKHRTCIDSDYTNATDGNLTGGMNFVVYYSKQP
jgi:hypothetical protein